MCNCCGAEAMRGSRVCEECHVKRGMYHQLNATCTLPKSNEKLKQREQDLMALELFFLKQYMKGFKVPIKFMRKYKLPA